MKPVLFLSACLGSLLAVPHIHSEETKPAPFKLVGMTCYSDKILNKAEITEGGFKLEAGVKVGNIPSRGSEIAEMTFPETQLIQYFDFTFSPESAGKEVTVEVVSAKTTAGINELVTSLSGRIDGSGLLPAEWKLTKNWPVGLYKVVFSFEGQIVGSAGYLVNAIPDRETPIKAGEVAVYSIKEGKGTPVTTIKSSDNSLSFECPTTGSSTKGAVVRMWLEQVDENGGGTEIAPLVVEVGEWPLDNTALKYSLDVPGEMPLGKYKLIYAINGEPLANYAFEVKE